MKRFVVLEHDHPRGRHWDLMLEQREALTTWALPAPPTIGCRLQVVQLPDHRLAYLDYEGPISGGRGAVSRWEKGLYALIENTETRIEAALFGEQFQGIVRLVPDGRAASTWSLTAHPCERDAS